MATKKSMTEALAPVLTILYFYGFSSQSNEVGLKSRLKRVLVTIGTSVNLLGASLIWSVIFYLFIVVGETPTIYTSARDTQTFSRRYVIYFTNLFANIICISYVVFIRKSRAIINLLDFIELNPQQFKIVRRLANMVTGYYVFAIIAFLSGIMTEFQNPENKYIVDGKLHIGFILVSIALNLSSLGATLCPVVVTMLIFLNIVITKQVGQHYDSCKAIRRYRSPISASREIQNLLLHNYTLDQLIREADAFIAPIIYINLQFPPSAFVAIITVFERNFTRMAESMTAAVVAGNYIMQILLIVIYLMMASRTNAMRLRFVRAIQQTTMYDDRIGLHLPILQRRINHLIEIVHVRLQPDLFTLGFNEKVGFESLLMVVTRLIELSFHFKFYEE